MKGTDIEEIATSEEVLEARRKTAHRRALCTGAKNCGFYNSRIRSLNQGRSASDVYEDVKNCGRKFCWEADFGKPESPDYGLD